MSRYIRWALPLLVLLGSPPAMGAGEMQNLGRLLGIVGKAAKGLAPVSQEQEVAIGRHLASMLVGATPLLGDANIQRYVNRVGRWLALHSERPDLEWRFGVLDTDSINAFAAPGGYVFISRGLLDVMHSEAELAGVLAHEMGHVLRRHHLAAIQKQAWTQMAVDLAGLAVSSSDRQGYFNAISKIGMNLYARGLDRDDEMETDRIGVVLASRSGYDPYGLPTVLAALNDINAGDSRISLMFATHPPTGDRIRLLDEEMRGVLDGLAGNRTVAARFQRQASGGR